MSPALRNLLLKTRKELSLVKAAMQDQIEQIRETALATLSDGDLMFFAVLVLFFFARQAGMRMDVRSHELIGDWHPVLLPPILYINTAVLLLSSIAMELARR